FVDQRTDGDCPQEYSITRTWTAKDACGNTSTASQTIKVTDETLPTLIGNLPPDITLDNYCSDPSIPEPPVITGDDNCDDDVEVIYTETIDDMTEYPISFKITRTWTAMDDCGNVSETHTQMISVPYCCSDETAFAYQEGNCFIQGGGKKGKGKGKGGRWGWYIEDNLDDVMANGGVITYPFIAGAGLCDLESGTEVGTVSLLYDDGKLFVTYNIMNADLTADEIYTIGTVHVYAGCEAPSKLAPGQYGNTGEAVEMSPGIWVAMVELDPSDIDCSGEAYVIAHAEVDICRRVDPPVDSALEIISDDNESLESIDEEVVERREVVEFKVAAYPNPTTDKLSIKLEGLQADMTTIRFINNIGELVKEITLTDPAVHELNLNLSNELENGIYHLQVFNGEDFKTLTIMLID
uniref:T9SS type A sorting domain-containing protein n=1 Tax=Portibacter marinus TaxID=2898660 RepID=UPI001F340DDB